MKLKQARSNTYKETDSLQVTYTSFGPLEGNRQNLTSFADGKWTSIDLIIRVILNCTSDEHMDMYPGYISRYLYPGYVSSILAKVSGYLDTYPDILPRLSIA